MSKCPLIRIFTNSHWIINTSQKSDWQVTLHADNCLSHSSSTGMHWIPVSTNTLFFCSRAYRWWCCTAHLWEIMIVAASCVLFSNRASSSPLALLSQWCRHSGPDCTATGTEALSLRPGLWNSISPGARVTWMKNTCLVDQTGWEKSLKKTFKNQQVQTSCRI